MNSVFCQAIKIDQLEAIKVEHPLFTATLLLQGAQLIEFAPNSSNNNLLWLSDTVEYKQGKPLRGGIPICWPWFGNMDKNPTEIQQQIEGDADAHGFARSMPWQVHSITESCHHVEIILQLTSNQKTQALWPFEFNLQARFVFTSTLEVVLTTTNTGNKTFAISQALHTYFPTDDITQTYIHNALGSRYIDALDDWKEKRQEGRISFSEETDRLYFFNKHNSHYELRVESPNQQLILKNSGSQSAVIWNPWVEKSKRLSQFSPQDYQSMYCIETANVMSDYKKLAPNQQQILRFELSLL